MIELPTMRAGRERGCAGTARRIPPEPPPALADKHQHPKTPQSGLGTLMGTGGAATAPGGANPGGHRSSAWGVSRPGEVGRMLHQAMGIVLF